MRGRPRAAAAPRCTAGAQRDGAAGPGLCGARPCRELPQPGPEPGPQRSPQRGSPRRGHGPGIAPRSPGRVRKRSCGRAAPGVGARPDITVRTGLCGERKNTETGKDGKRIEKSGGSGRRLRYLPKEVVFAVKLAFSRKAFLCQIAFTFTALNTLHMPSPVQYIQQEPVQDWPFAARTVNHCLWLFLRVGYRRPRWQAKNRNKNKKTTTAAWVCFFFFLCVYVVIVNINIKKKKKPWKSGREEKGREGEKPSVGRCPRAAGPGPGPAEADARRRRNRRSDKTKPAIIKKPPRSVTSLFSGLR